MAYWLMKSEPDVYPWSKLVTDKKGMWDGVRNHQAARNLRAMAVGDEAFFYHSNEGREIVGIMRIVKTAYPDPTDKTKKFVAVDVAPVRAFIRSVTLATIKNTKTLAGMQLLKQSRLSVSSVTAGEWREILRLEKAA